MTLTAAPWALDGARTPASVARLGARAAVKQSGIINPGDMKVLQLAVAGNGVRISSGGAVLENRYELDVNQAYVVEAVSEEILDSTDNFSSIVGQGSAQSHLICVTIGDPNYSTAGHPWLTDGNKPADAEAALDYQYVRAWVLKNVPAGTMRVEDLPSPPTFPCYALARIDVPAGSGSITSGMIVDLREVVNARSKMAQFNIPIAVNDPLSTSGNYVFETFPDNSVSPVYVPKWATKVYVTGWVVGMTLGSTGELDAGFRAEMRTLAGTLVGQTANSVLYMSNGAVGENKNAFVGGPIAIPAANRGTTLNFSTAACLANTATMNLKLATTTRTSVMLQLRFVEEAV